MASDKRQLAVRLSPAGSELFDGLMERVAASLGVELSQGQIVEMGLRALAEKYPAEDAGAKKSKGK